MSAPELLVQASIRLIPQVLNFERPGTGVRLRDGMAFTIEPMVNQGSRKVSTEDDGWAVATIDRKLSAQFERTVAVMRSGVEVLTIRRDEMPMLARVA